MGKHRTPYPREFLFSWIEGWYDISRLHSSFGYCSPFEFENLHAKTQTGSHSRLPTAGLMVVTGAPPPGPIPNCRSVR
jgi:hypothetical protein